MLADLVLEPPPQGAHKVAPVLGAKRIEEEEGLLFELDLQKDPAGARRQPRRKVHVQRPGRKLPTARERAKIVTMVDEGDERVHDSVVEPLLALQAAEVKHSQRHVWSR